MKVDFDKLPVKALTSIFLLRQDDIILDEFDVVWRVVAPARRDMTTSDGLHGVMAHQVITRFHAARNKTDLVAGGPSSYLDFKPGASVAVYTDEEIVAAIGQ
jgi:hypothetical protein